MTICARCGQENPEGFRFCGRCGSALDAPPAAEERKVVTILFADLVGFTSRSERMDVEDVRGTLAPYHALLRDRLEHHGGTVEKFIGDAVMAVFGAPVAHEDDPERAVRAALAIRAAIDRLNEEQPDLDLHVRIGVNTGEALVVVGADAGRGEGMASGDVVNTAARLQTAAPVDGILVGATTYYATDRAINYAQAEPVAARGKANPVEAWQALEARAAFGVDVVQRPTTGLVGRREELDLMLDALRRCRAERTVQLVTLVGVPGIGKSRLVWELFQAVDADPDLITWRQGRSLPYGDGVTYWALGEMLNAQAGILDTDTAEQAEAKLRATVADLFADPAERAWVEEHARALAGLGSQDAGSAERAGEATAAWRRFFEALADRQPLVLVFEDVHWADDALLDFVDHLVEWSSGVPMLVVCTTRPELLDRRRDWGGGQRNALTIALSPLPDDDVARLIGSLLEQALLPAETQAALLSTAAGNPLYAEEYVRMLIDRGYLRRDGDRWHLAAVELPVPESVQGLIAARLDDLPASEKRLIQDAAVLGKVIWLGAVAEMGDIDRFAAEERLHALERRELVRRERRSSVGGETEYAFRHILVRDVAYGQIPRAQRSDKHRRAAEWIETLSSDRETTPDMLAHHYSRALEYGRDAGEDTEELERRARLALRDAAERALALNSVAAALHHYYAAIELWPEPDPDWPALIVAAADVTMVGAPIDLPAMLDRARDRLVAAGELDVAAKAEMVAAFRYWNSAMSEEANARFDNSLALLDPAEPSPTVARVLSRLAIQKMLRGEFEETAALCQRALAVAERFGLEDIHCHVLNTLGVARVNHGDAEGIADVEKSVEIAERMNRSEPMIRGYKNLGSTLYGLGEVDRAEDLERRGLEAATRFGLDYQIAWFDTELGLISFIRGDWEAAWQSFDRLAAWVDSVGPHYMEGVAYSCRAKILAARGDSEAARIAMDRMLQLARSSGEPQMLFPALADAALLAAMTAGSDAPARVAALYEELADAVAEGSDQTDWTLTITLALALTGQLDRFGIPLDDDPWRWPATARSVVQGQFARAADQLAGLGDRPSEAIARMLAARDTIGQGRKADGEAELRRAIDFWKSVQAGAYLGKAEAMLARIA